MKSVDYLPVVPLHGHDPVMQVRRRFPRDQEVQQGQSGLAHRVHQGIGLLVLEVLFDSGEGIIRLKNVLSSILV